MKAETANNDFEKIISSLSSKEKNLIKKLHNHALSLGYAVKISDNKKNPNDWKCEYFKNKKSLFVLQITDNKWSVKCRLNNIANYNEELEKCSQHSIETLLKNSGDCGNHKGSCKGPLEFSIGKTKYIRCRHSLVFDNITKEDIDSIIKLLDCENSFI